jgi:hypothetical protein
MKIFAVRNENYELYVIHTARVLTVNIELSNERNITYIGRLASTAILEQVPEDGTFVPKHVGVYVCHVYYNTKYICWLIY